MRERLMSLLVAALFVACDAGQPATSAGLAPEGTPVGSELNTTTPAPSSLAALRRASLEAEVEIGVATVATGQGDAVHLAVAPDGRAFFATAGGLVFAGDPERSRLVAELKQGETVLGLAADRAPRDAHRVYALVGAAGGETELRRFTVREATEQETGEGLVDVERLGTWKERPTWNGNALAFDGERNLYAAIGPGEATELDVDKVALQLLRNRTSGVSSTETGPAAAPDVCLDVSDRFGEPGPWDLVLPRSGIDASSKPVLRETLDGLPAGALAAVVYGEGSVPQWSGSVFFVTDGGRLLRIPHGEDRCFDVTRAEVLYPGRFDRFYDIAPGWDGHLYALASASASSSQAVSGGLQVLRIGSLAGLGLRYPDLQTDSPSDLVLDSVQVEGETRQVVRFTNLVVNRGEGPLELRQSGDGEHVVQRVYAEDGSFIERPAGRVAEHWSHGHWHFEHFNRFEIWEREAYERMQAGADRATPLWVEDKVSMCLMDLLPIDELPGAPEAGRYGDECEAGEQGISVGWGDRYPYNVPEQWVAMTDDGLADGNYVLRTIVDSEGILHESPDGRDVSRESREANSAVVFFAVSDGRLTVHE